LPPPQERAGMRIPRRDLKTLPTVHWCVLVTWKLSQTAEAKVNHPFDKTDKKLSKITGWLKIIVNLQLTFRDAL
jgi:hypothetical protein